MALDFLGGELDKVWDGVKWVGGQVADGLDAATESRANNEFREIDQKNFDLPNYWEISGSYKDQVRRLQDQANGRGPSLANMQMQRGLQSALAQQQALAQSGRGNPAMAARQAAINSGNIAQNLAGQGTMARLAEQRQGQQMLQGALQGQVGLSQAKQRGMMGYEEQRGRNYATTSGVPTQGENVKGGIMDALELARKTFTPPVPGVG